MSKARLHLPLIVVLVCGQWLFCRGVLGAEREGMAKAASSASAPASSEAPPLKPNLKFPTLSAYEAKIAEPGVLLQNERLLLFAPKRKKNEAETIFKYLADAYGELRQIVGQNTKYKIVVYHLPKGWGGTSECVIEYDYGNLDFDKSEEWKEYEVPHVSGYIEEMAHNFVSATEAQFGWEMIGWSIGVEVTRKVAGNAAFDRHIQDTRDEQARTYARYKALGDTLPRDVEANKCDRIHAYLLWQCEQAYGPQFWKDFFTLVRGQRAALDKAVNMSGDDAIRNERYRITVECFDRMPGVNFKKLLAENGISASVDAKSLHPTKAGWNRKFVP